MKLNLPVLLGLALLLRVAACSGMDFESLRALIETQHLRSVESVLERLAPVLRYRYALVFSSRSLQGASYQAPRVILYGMDARLVVTFNGDPGQAGYLALETLEFDAERHEFLFREILFPPAGEPKAPVQFSASNPPRCQSCHGSVARPIWDSWPLWPGAYGQRYGMRLSAAERDGLEQFLARRNSDPRYRHLLGAERFANEETFRPTSRSRYSGTVEEPPNAELAALLGDLMNISIARELEQQRAFSAFRYALLGLSSEHCGGVAEFLPPGSWRGLREEWRHFADGVERANALQAATKLRRLGLQTATELRSAEAAPPHLLELRFLAEQALDVKTSWTMALERGSGEFGAPSASRSLHDALLDIVARQDPAVGELAPYETSSDGDRYCSYLQQRSRVALRNLPVATASSTQAQSETPGEHVGNLVEICASCHEAGVGPVIPFRDAARLRAELQTSSAPHGTLLDEVLFRLSVESRAARMPLGIELAEPERSALERYFRTLAGR